VSLKIPKIIHQIYENIDVPKHLLTISETWKENHSGWEYRFWNKLAIDSFLQSHCSEYILQYQSFPYDVQRWDAIRYLILFHFGGLYVDMDYECIAPLDALLYDSTCCMGLEPPDNAYNNKKPYIVGNALMASIPKHVYFEKIIENVFSQNNISHTNKFIQVMETTGPFMTTRIYDELSDKETVTLLPAELIAPLSINEVRQLITGNTTEKMEEKVEKAFAIHYFLGSWYPQTNK
jgi:mannosyltransferase OCH1-like enzyme